MALMALVYCNVRLQLAEADAKQAAVGLKRASCRGKTRLERGK